MFNKKNYNTRVTYEHCDGNNVTLTILQRTGVHDGGDMCKDTQTMPRANAGLGLC